MKREREEMNDTDFQISKKIKIEKEDEIKKNENEKEDEIKKNEIETKKKILILKEISDNQPTQRTKEWFELRKTRITASDVASCLKKISTVCKHYMKDYGLEKSFKYSEKGFCNPYSNESDFVLKKNGYSNFETNPAVKWGNKYEQAVVCFYEKNFSEEVWEFGLILHQYIDWLACSPDGITPNGKMIEIKCPFRRKITGIPPLYYWIQCQIQLEVCDLEICDYIECNIQNLTKEQWENTDQETIYIFQDENFKTERQKKVLQSKGILININNKYYYPPNKYKTVEDMTKWANKKIKKYEELKPDIEYYKINEYSLVPIKRNKNWFNIIKPMLEKTWKKVKDFDIKSYEKYLDEKNNKNEDDKISLDLREDKNDVCLLSDTE